MSKKLKEKSQMKVETQKKKHRGLKIFLIVIAVIVAIVIFLLSITPWLIMKDVLGQHIEREVYNSADFNVEAEEVTLMTDDELKIASWFVEAENPKANIIILSGIEAPSVTAFFTYAKVFQDRGFNTLLVEMRAHNASEGDEVKLGTEEWMDVKAGVEFLETRTSCPSVVLGTSMGGATSLVALGEIPELAGAISISAYSSFPDAFVDNMKSMGVPSFYAALQKPFANLYFGIHFGFDQLNYTPINSLQKFDGRPVLFMHTTQDTQVPFESFERLTKKAEELGVNYATSIREADDHFFIKNNMFETPEIDPEFFDIITWFIENDVLK